MILLAIPFAVALALWLAWEWLPALRLAGEGALLLVVLACMSEAC